jgi:hypothetical protein
LQVATPERVKWGASGCIQYTNQKRKKIIIKKTIVFKQHFGASLYVGLKFQFDVMALAQHSF